MDMARTTNGRVTPWNKGKLLFQKPPLKLKEIWAVRIRDRWVLGGVDGLDRAADGTHSLRRSMPTLIYRRTKNLGPFNCYSDTQSSKAPSGIWASKLTTRSRSPSKPRCSPAKLVAAAGPDVADRAKSRHICRAQRSLQTGHWAVPGFHG
jgi:hypothetical protein